MTVSSQTNNNN